MKGFPQDITYNCLDAYMRELFSDLLSRNTDLLFDY